MTNDIPLTTPSPPLARARFVLAGLLAGDPPLEARLSVAAALAVLDDVVPPHPPLPEDVPPLPTATGLTNALELLRAAIGEATTIAELTRIGTAALELRQAAAVTP